METYNKYYKIIAIIPVVILIASLIYLGIFYQKNNDFIYRDSTLSGGTTITIDGDVDLEVFKGKITAVIPDAYIRSIENIQTGERTAILIDSLAEPDVLKLEVEKILGYPLTEENSSIEFTGSGLSESFYRQLIIALALSFVLMSIVIFILFRSAVPSLAIIFAAFSGIVMTIAIVNLLGIRISAAGIAAFLMLIGYSVDINILLTSRVLKHREGSVNERIWRSFKTGMFMTTTALLSVLPAFFIITNLPESFRQIFLIVGIGLCADIFNTWMTNAGILKWYAEKMESKK